MLAMQLSITCAGESPHKTYLIFPTELARIMIIVSVLDSLNVGPWGTGMNKHKQISFFLRLLENHFQIHFKSLSLIGL